MPIVTAAGNEANAHLLQHVLLRASLLRAESPKGATYVAAAHRLAALRTPYFSVNAARECAHPLHSCAPPSLPGIGPSISRFLCQHEGDVAAAATAAVGCSFDDAAAHEGLLRTWLPHLNPHLIVHATGAHRRGILWQRSLKFLVTDTRTTAQLRPHAMRGDGDVDAQLLKITQFLRLKGYVRATTSTVGASRMPGHATVRLRVCLGDALLPAARYGAASKGASCPPGAEHRPKDPVPASSQEAEDRRTISISITLVPHDVYFANLLLTTGPAVFCASALRAASDGGYTLTQAHGLARGGSSTAVPVALRSELELFQTLRMPYVAPIDR